MPLVKSKSKEAFKKNVKKEIAAGRPPKQAVAIAYATKKAAKKDPKSESHSKHSEARSKHYHDNVVATKVYSGRDMMTQARSQKLQNDEDYGE